MKYMILIYNDPALEPAYGTPAFDAMMGGFFAANEKMGADGVLVSGEGLQGIACDMTKMIKNNPIPSLLIGVGLGFLIARATTPRS